MADAAIHLCGRFSAALRGRPVGGDATSPRERELLAYLVLNRGRAVPREELIDALWPHDAPAAPEAALRVVLSRARTAFGKQVIVGRSELSLVLPDDAWIDVEAAAHALDEGRVALAAKRTEAACRPLGLACEILARELLPGIEAPWLHGRRRQLASVRALALECAAEAALRLGDASGAEVAARTLTEIEPYRESGYLLLMRVLAAEGNVAEALLAYDELRVRLREELGTAPGAELKGLQVRLLQGAPAAEDPVAGLDAPPLPMALEAKAVAPFVGRDGALDRLDAALEDAASGARAIVLVGEPGIGKTAIAARAARRFADRGAGVLYGRSQEEPLTPYQAFAEALLPVVTSSRTSCVA